MRQAFRIDDLSAIVRDRELARPDFAARTINIDFRNYRQSGAVALNISEAASGHGAAALTAARRRRRPPAGFLGRGLDYGDVSGIGDILQMKRDRIELQLCGHFVDEGLACK